MRFSDLCRRLGRFFIPARSDTLPPVRVLPLELIGFPLTPFGKPALPLGFFGAVLPPLGAMFSDGLLSWIKADSIPRTAMFAQYQFRSCQTTLHCGLQGGGITRMQVIACRINAVLL